MNVNDLQGKTVGFLASGGLDSCTTTAWLTENGVNVVSFTADLGQPDEDNLDEVAERMLGCGASDAIIVPLREEMAKRGIWAIQAQARYEGRYWNTTPLGRIVTVQGIIPEMQKRGITIMSHGATGRGNDQLRMQLITNMLAPEIDVYAPWRDQSFLDRFPGREEMLEFCRAKGLPIKNPKVALYSTDANLLGLTHEAGELESISTPVNFVTPGMGVRATEAPDATERIEIRFESGVPVTINGKQMTSAAEVMELANEIGGRNGVGINLHVVENRFIGMKSRGVYEAPGMELLGQAYEYLLQLVLDRRAREWFDVCGATLAKQLYQSYGLDLASQMMEASVDTVTQLATGTITLDCYKGNLHFVEAKDIPHSVFIEELASMSAVGDFDHKDSEGFVRVLGQGAKASAAAGIIKTNKPETKADAK